MVVGIGEGGFTVALSLSAAWRNFAFPATAMASLHYITISRIRWRTGGRRAKRPRRQGANMYAANVISRQPTLIPAEADGGGVEFWSTIWREHERNCRGGGMLAGWPFPPCEGGRRMRQNRKRPEKVQHERTIKICIKGKEMAQRAERQGLPAARLLA